MISELQSSLEHKVCRLPERCRLVFVSKPNSIDDPPAPLDPSHPRNSDFIVLEMFVDSNIKFVHLQEETDDHELQGHRRAMLRELDFAKVRLELLLRDAWEQEKAAIHLFDGHYDRMEIVNTGTLPK